MPRGVKNITSTIEKVVPIIEEKPNLVKVLDRATKQRIILDANKFPNYKNDYLHISGNKFTI